MAEVKIKICGIRDMDGVAFLNRWLPDYAGFVFAPGKRQVTTEQARLLAEGLVGGIRRVGVFVGMSPEKVAETVMVCGLQAAQLHGDETPEELSNLRSLLPVGIEIWKAIRVRDRANVIAALRDYPADRLLLEPFVEGFYGGTGKTFDWSLAEAAGEKKGIILAGGLDPGNVARAVRQVAPFAVDVSSGVETDGRKDGNKIRDFIHAVRNCCSRTES